MRLLLLHPLVAWRDCEHCLKYRYDEKTGKPETQRRSEELIPRDEAFPALCRTAKGCPKGTPEQSKALTEQNLQAYEHHMECKAVGQFPDDPIVRRNAMLIEAVREQVAEFRRQEFETAVLLSPGR